MLINCSSRESKQVTPAISVIIALVGMQIAPPADAPLIERSISNSSSHDLTIDRRFRQLGEIEKLSSSMAPNGPDLP